MPTYSYRCKSCDHAFDLRQEFTDDALTECPRCAGALRKVFGSVGVTFKGSGFYRTDSRAGATPSATSAGTSGSSGGSAAAGSSGGSAAGGSSGGSAAAGSGSPPGA